SGISTNGLRTTRAEGVTKSTARMKSEGESWAVFIAAKRKWLMALSRRQDLTGLSIRRTAGRWLNRPIQQIGRRQKSCSKSVKGQLRTVNLSTSGRKEY